MFLAYLWPWTQVKVIKSGMNLYTASKMPSLKALHYAVSEKKATSKVFVFFNSENTTLISLEYMQKCETKVMSWSRWRSQHSYKVCT